MEYRIKAHSLSKNKGSIQIKNSDIDFGITTESIDTQATPAELFLGSFSSCILKGVERFSEMMKFEYSSAKITVSAVRLENPPRMDEIKYELIIYSKDEKLNITLLKKNLEKYGTIFNTVQSSCSIIGNVIQLKT